MGGLLGLGLGLSFISVIEFFYFLFVRLFMVSREKNISDEIPIINDLLNSFVSVREKKISAVWTVLNFDC